MKFRFKWPCILPKEQLYIDLPNEISSINNLGMMEYIKIKYKYLDSELSIYEGVQEIDPKLMEEGLKGYLESEVVEEAVEDV